MKDVEGRRDYHIVLTGASPQPSAQLYHAFLSAISKSSFLKVQEADEKSWFLKVVSSRMEDPRGVIEIKLVPIPRSEEGTEFFLRINDEKFLTAFYDRDQRAKYSLGTLIGLLTEQIRQSRFDPA